VPNGGRIPRPNSPAGKSGVERADPWVSWLAALAAPASDELALSLDERACRNAFAAAAHELGLRLKATTLDAFASVFEQELMDEARSLLGK
jgi:hypothetical protein